MLIRIVSLLTLSVCVVASAQTPPPAPAPSPELANIAFAVLEPDAAKVEQILRAGLRSQNPKARAAAARVVNIRRVTSLADHVRTTLDRELDADAAREEVRTAVMMGNAQDVDRALWVSERFGKRLDAVTGAAAARLGAATTSIYFASLQKRDIDAVDFFRNALWGRSQEASALAQQLLKAKDGTGFASLTFALRDDPHDLIDLNVLSAAFENDDDDERIRTAAAWYLVYRGAASKAPMPLDERFIPLIKPLKFKEQNRQGQVAAELLRRLSGLSKATSQEFRTNLGASVLSQLRIALAPRRLYRFLTPDERPLILGGVDLPEVAPEGGAAPYALPSPLPNGVADAVLNAAACTAAWSGTASVTADASGRVTSADLSKVTTTEGCRRALDTLIRLSIVDNDYVTAPFENRNVTLVHARKCAPCFDEGPQSHHGGDLFGRPSFRFPRIRKVFDPEVPANTKKGEVVVETVISALGCVRAVRLVKGTGNPAVDDAALTAVSQWTFEPARYDLLPVQTTLQLHVDVGK